MRINHLFTCFVFAIANLPMKRKWRPILYSLGGVEINGKHQLIGRNVVMDTVYPSSISLGSNVHITNGCVLLTHYLDTESDFINWKYGSLSIGDNSFIGTNTIIAKPVKIGKNVIVGAGSVVTKDIPDNQIWAGNPARLIKIRNI